VEAWVGVAEAIDRTWNHIWTTPYGGKETGVWRRGEVVSQVEWVAGGGTEQGKGQGVWRRGKVAIGCLGDLCIAVPFATHSQFK